MQEIRLCENCQKPFTFRPKKPTKKNPGRFCSIACKYQAKQYNRVCPACHKPFTVARSRVATGCGRGTFCSKTCYLIHKKRNQTDGCCLQCGKHITYHPARPRKYCSLMCKRDANSQARICPVCQKPYRVGNYLIRQGFGLYCSKECWHQDHHISKTCPQCGTVFTRRKGNERIYCSKECAQAATVPWNKGKTYSLPKNHRTHVASGQTQLLICKWCGEQFYAQKNRVKMGQGCCNAEHRRLYEQNRNTMMISCRGCGKQFWVKMRDRNGVQTTYRTFCSDRCRQANYNAAEGFCEMCGKRIKVHHSHKSPHAFCSRQCANQGLTLEASLYNRKGITTTIQGYRIKATKDHYPARHPGEREARKYRAEHRLVAERILGRCLKYNDEPIWHVNGRVGDNRPENLYVFGTRSELTRVITGAEAAPTESNLPLLVQYEKAFKECHDAS